MEGKASLVVVKPSMVATTVSLAPVDGFEVLSNADFPGAFHVVLGVESSVGAEVVGECAWGSGSDGSVGTTLGGLWRVSWRVWGN